MVMYGPTAYLTKVCLLWIMTRVFNPFRKAVIFIYVFMGIMLAYYIPAVIVKIRICNPIGSFWNKDIKGTCLDETSIILADAVVSMVSDLIILILPLPLTMSLQMPRKKKMRVIGLLGAGGLAVTASVIRLALIVTTGQSKDATYAFMRINMLGYVYLRDFPGVSSMLTGSSSATPKLPWVLSAPVSPPFQLSLSASTTITPATKQVNPSTSSAQCRISPRLSGARNK